MPDIHTIKNLFNILSYLKKETWYMLGIGIIVYVIYVTYVAVFERYYKIQNGLIKTSVQRASIQDTLRALQSEDPHFFERLSFIIRSHLESTWVVLLATKKTAENLQKESLSPHFKEILNVCSYYEYTGETADKEKKREILERIMSII